MRVDLLHRGFQNGVPKNAAIQLSYLYQALAMRARYNNK
jgi:hypothetical protein